MNPPTLARNSSKPSVQSMNACRKSLRSPIGPTVWIWPVDDLIGVGILEHSCQVSLLVRLIGLSDDLHVLLRHRLLQTPAATLGWKLSHPDHVPVGVLEKGTHDSTGQG